MSKIAKYVIALGIFALCSTAALSQEDEQDWWFNIEVIVFKRDLLPTNSEDFSQTNINSIDVAANQILVLSSLKQQAAQDGYFQQLPLCDGTETEYRIPIDFNLEDVPALVKDDWWQIKHSLKLSLAEEEFRNPEANSVQQQQNEMDVLINSLQQGSQSLTITVENEDAFDENSSQVNSFRNKSMLSESIIQSPEYQQRIPLISKSLEKRETEALEAYIGQLIDFSVRNDLSMRNDLYEEHARIQPIRNNSDIVGHTANITTQVIDEYERQIALIALNAEVNNLINSIAQYEDLNAQLSALECRSTKLWMTYPKAINLRLFASEKHFKETIHLVDESELALAEFAQQIFRQRDIQPLLYASWRDNIVFGIDNAPFVRLVAGELLTVERSTELETYEEWLEEYKIKEALKSISIQGDSASKDDIDAQNKFFDELEKAVKENKQVSWLKLESSDQQDSPDKDRLRQAFEVDGVFKVYLDYVNQVPYLHIDSELNHVKLELDRNGDSKLTVYPFKQRRRIISKQIHYFDHPAFGMIVRLERFVPPDPISEDKE